MKVALRISNLHQIWEGFLVILPQKFLQLPLVKLVSTVCHVNLSSGVITFCKNEDEKSKFAEDFWHDKVMCCGKSPNFHRNKEVLKTEHHNVHFS